MRFNEENTMMRVIRIHVRGVRGEGKGGIRVILLAAIGEKGKGTTGMVWAAEGEKIDAGGVS
jgi:hypothetical protein